MRRLGTIENGMIIDSLKERKKSLEDMLDGLNSFHMNVNSFYTEIEAYTNLIRLIREG